MDREAELEAELTLLRLEKRMVAAKDDPNVSPEDTAALKEEVRARRALTRAGRDYTRVNATIEAANEAGDTDAVAAANAELALLDKVTAAAAKHLGVSTVDLKKARNGAPPPLGPGDAAASPTPATAAGNKGRG